MRFIKRLSAVALAIVITVSSIQIPGGISYAAEPADGIANGQDVTILTAEETEEDTGMAEGESQPDEGTVTDGGSQTDDKYSALGDDSQRGDDNAAGDESQRGDDNAAGDDDQTNHENVSEEETDAGQVSGNDAGEPAQSVDTEETETEETKVVEAEIKGAYQFDDAPSVGGMSVFSVSTYDNSVEDYLYQQMLKRADRIDISAYNVSVSDVGNLVSGVLNEHPDLYFVNRMYNYGYGPSYETIADLYMTYSTDYDDAAFKKKAEAALACVTDGMSDDMKATVLHDYLVINVEYDYDNLNSNSIPEDSFNAYGTLVNGTAVCNGYALAYKYLLNQAGIECCMVTSSSMNHAWNMVKLDGEYYHVDTTWDDPVRDMVGRVCHDNLFRSDTNFGEHYGWTVTSGSSAVDYKATDSKYENAFWTDSKSPLVFDGTDCYYISNTGMSLKKTSFSNFNAAGTDVVSVGRWRSGSGGYWVGAFSGLYRINGRLFYNDGDSIYSINPDGTGKKTEFTPEKTGSNQIYYSAYRNGKVVYALQTSPNLSEKQIVLTAEIEGVGEPEPPEETYNITYVLDGGTNDKDNPATYTAGTKTIVLKDAAKAGYKFEGWYKDSAYMQKVTEIPIGSTGNIMLYAKWTKLEDRLDLPNFDQTYSGIDGKKLSSKADGKPKLLVFFMWDQDAGKETMQNITGIIDSLSGVDVYAIDMTQSSSVSDLTKNTKEYKKAYGCDEIKFAYADWYKPANYDKGDDYQQAAGLSGMYLPLMCYIDKDNRLQWVSDHEQTGRQILANLEKYCDYHTENPPEEQGTYKITYVLDGGVNNEDNPDTYTAETETIVLKDPSKTNCVFEGWYEDARYNKRVTEIARGSEGNITLYAKWKKTGLDAANLNYTFTTLDEQTASSRAEGKPKVLFFFKPDCLNCKQTSQSLSDNIEAFGGADIYAVEISNRSKEDVAKFKEDFGCDEITYCYDKDRTYNACLWDYVRNIIHVDNGGSVTTPVIVFIDSENRVQYGTAGLRSWTDILTDLQEYCGYAYGNMEGIYKISYALDGGTNDEYNPGTYTADTQTIWLRDAAKEGYMFDGWYTDAEFKNKVTYILKGTTGDITLYAKWKKSAENPEYTFTTIDDETVSSRAEGKPKVLFFFKPDCQYCRNTSWSLNRYIKGFCGADIYAVEISERTKEEVVKFKEDFGCDEITYCYDKDGTYNTCFWDYVRDITHIGSGSVQTPVLVFIDSENQVQYATSGERSAFDILADLRQHCGYDYYWIDYYLAYGEDNSENPEFYKSSGDTITLKDPVREGYKFRGWYKDLEYTQKVTQIPTGTTGDITLYPKWLKKEEGLGLANLDRTFTALDDTELSSKANGRPKLLIFVSKAYESDNIASSVVKAISQSISSFAGVDIYVIDYDFNSKEDVSKYKDAYGCDEMKFAYDITNGTRSIIIEYLKAAGQQYLWTMPPVICYIDENDFLQWISQGQISVQTILDNLDIYCDYTSEGETPLPAGTYKITYILNGGTNSSENPATYTAETETITLADAVRDGYIFAGWYKDAEFKEQVRQIVKGSTGNIRLYARWRAEASPDDPEDPDNQDDIGIYQVIFNVQGHGTAPQTLVNIKAGSTIDSPVEPVADGYRFDGWYKDSACTKPWDFVTDTVQSNLTLYAKWLGISSDSEFAVQEIADLYYNGKAQKPAVSVYNENTLLKAGKDYTVKYYNNINANKNGVLKGEAYNAALPYVEITGKGNYKETVRINFNILRSSIGNDLRPTAGVTLKVNDQLVKTSKDQKPFGSIKYGRNMKEGTDYELELSIVSARDGYGINAIGTCVGAKVPANYTGEFMLTVKGTGNYTGSISRRVYVADKEHLMKNMKITLGKNLKNRPYTGSKIELKAAAKAKPANDEFVVTYGKKALIPGVDYDVSYHNNVGVGKAELVVTGKNGYVGSKTATFNIKGKTFTNGTVTVTGLQDQVYTGRAIIQNAGLTWKADGSRLVYGVDYTVSYSKNINKGTATITFTGKAKAGYSGKVSKKFKITAANISEMTRAQSMNAITLPYTKAGVKPVDEIILTNERGIRLSNGKDYTLAYKNNKAVANAAAGNAPTVTVKGKGNYSGSFEVKFTIVKADLGGENENITIECAQAAYDSKKAADYEYKPTVTIKDGKTKLKAGTDYEISYVRNTQAAFVEYVDSGMLGWLKPAAVITAKEGSAYTLLEPFQVPLEIYTEKLTKNNLQVDIGEAVYTGGQVRPRVTVNYGSLIEGRDYTLIYGANTASGKNKGSVTIKGLAPYYGGSVTYKFDITRKDLKYGFSPVIDEK